MQSQKTVLINDFIEKKVKWKLHMKEIRIIFENTLFKNSVTQYMGTINMSGWAVERWDPLTAHIDVCSKQSLIWAVGKIPKNCGFVLPLILMIAFSKH